MRRYALSGLGEQDERQVFYRRDAGCPVITHVRVRNEARRPVPGWLVNISEDGCLITSDHFPERAKDLYLVFPTLAAKVFGRVARQGEFTLDVQFRTHLTADVVERIARLTRISG